MRSPPRGAWFETTNFRQYLRQTQSTRHITQVLQSLAMMDLLILMAAWVLMALLVLALALAVGVLLYALGLWVGFFAQVWRVLALGVLGLVRFFLLGVMAWQRHDRR